MAVYTSYCSSGSKAERYALRLTLTLNSQDKVNNKSNISYKLQLAGASYFGLDVDYTGSSFYGYTCNGSITIKNKSTGTTLATASGSSDGTVSSSSAITIASGSATVPHNSDGSLTISVSGTFTGGLSSQTTGGTVSGTTTLTKIARASSVSATDGDIESTISIYINKTNENYTHTLAYEFYGLKGTIVDKTTEKNIPFPIPSSFYEKMPNAKQGPCTITCTTYSGSTSIGTSTYSFQVKTNEEKCKPTISNISIEDTLTTATEDPSILVKHISIPNIIATLTSKNSSSIKSYKVMCGDGQTISAESTNSSLNVTFQKEITNNIFSVSVTDSRGYTTTEEITTSWIEYIPLTINPSFSRVTPTDGNVKLVYEGKCFNGKVGDNDNVLTIRYRYKINTDSEYSEWVMITPTISGNTYQGTTTLSESYTYTEAYDFEIQVLDLLNTNGISETRSITRGIPVYWWNKTSFNVNGSIEVNGDLNIKDKELVYKNTIGELEDLQTTDKNSIVNAINEIAQNMKDIDSYSFGSKGYIRWKNGFQIAWVSQTVTAGGTQWGNIYYSDHSLGNWVKSFSTCYTTAPHCNSSTFWAAHSGASGTSAGSIRCFRPNANTGTIWIGATGFGKWK